jgi:hypothetical protein
MRIRVVVIGGGASLSRQQLVSPSEHAMGNASAFENCSIRCRMAIGLPRSIRWIEARSNKLTGATENSKKARNVTRIKTHQLMIFVR